MMKLLNRGRKHINIWYIFPLKKEVKLTMKWKRQVWKCFQNIKGVQD